MNILILGGTVFVGHSLTMESLRRGHCNAHTHSGGTHPCNYGESTTIFNRGNKTSENRSFDPYNLDMDIFKCVTQLIGDRITGDFEQLKDKKWDVVIDVPSFKPEYVKSALDYLYDNTSLYVFISSMSVHDIGKHPDSAYDNYCCDKRDAELLFSDKENSLILRPGILLGVGDNTNRFNYDNRGNVYWKHNNEKVTEPTMPVRDFSKNAFDLIEANERGIYEF